MSRRKPTRYSIPGNEESITATKLRRANRETQLDVMREWFYSKYEDPVQNTPYDEGYVYIWGGPYDAMEELQDEFGGLISDKAIEELANELTDISSEWSGLPGSDDIDDYLFASIAQTSEHKESFEKSLTNVEHLMRLRVRGQTQKHLLRLLYTNVITAVETYLSDLFISAVGNDKELLRKFVETTPEFKSEKISVSDVFKEAERIEKKARTYLMDVVWHHLKRVKPMFKDTLGISFPDDMGVLFKAVLIRHDLVHRNGKNKEGAEHHISKETVKDLINQARAFVSHVDMQTPSANGSEDQVPL